MPKLSEDPCRILPNPVWYEIKPSISKNHVHFDQEVNEEIHSETMDPSEVKEAYEIGEAFLLEDSKLYEKFQSQHNSSQSQMRKLFLKGGTLTDRISVLTLSIQHSPVHNLEALEKLITMVGKKSRTEAMLALSALKDLLTGTGVTKTCALLPQERKLVAFAERPHTASAAQLALWVFEDKLKTLVFRLLSALETLLRDPLAHPKRQALACVLALLVHAPEQEANLLRLLVHKLGDPDPALASRASQAITTLLAEHHPAMKAVVCEACRQFLQHPATPARAHYSTLVTLNQILLARTDADLARRLVEFYFERIAAHLQATERLQSSERSLAKFQRTHKNQMKRQRQKHRLDVPSESKDGDAKAEAATPPVLTKKESLRQKKEDLAKQAKLLSAILTGLHRALPYLDLPTLPEPWRAHLDHLFVWTHHADPVVQLHALQVLFFVQRLHVDLEDRFAASFHAFLRDLTRHVVAVPVQSMFLPLLRRVLQAAREKPAPDLRRVTAWLARSLEIALVQLNPGWVVGILGLLEDALGWFPLLRHSLVTPPPSTLPADQHLQRVPDAVPGTPFFHLHFLLEHYHPSVRCFAKKILSEESFHLASEIQGDPLELFSLVRFLDHFAEKKPKPVVVEKRSAHAKSIPLESYLHGKQHTLDHDFLKHFASVKPASKKAKKTKEESSDEEEGGEEEESDKEMDAIMSSMRKVHGVKFDDEEEEDDENDFDDDEEEGDFDDDDEGFDQGDSEDNSSEDAGDADSELQFSDDDGENDNDEDSDDGDEETTRRGSLSKKNKISSVRLSGTPFASAQAYSDLIESRLGLDDSENEEVHEEDTDDGDDNDDKKMERNAKTKQFKHKRKPISRDDRSQKSKQNISRKRKGEMLGRGFGNRRGGDGPPQKKMKRKKF